MFTCEATSTVDLNHTTSQENPVNLQQNEKGLSQYEISYWTFTMCQVLVVNGPPTPFYLRCPILQFQN
jgi:hypothetical protein